jgi:hypothetical protein
VDGVTSGRFITLRGIVFAIRLEYVTSLEPISLFHSSVFEIVSSAILFPWDYFAGYTKMGDTDGPKSCSFGISQGGKRIMFVFAHIDLLFAWFCYTLHFLFGLRYRASSRAWRLANLV